MWSLAYHINRRTTNRDTELCEISKNDAVSVNECVVEQQKNPNCLGVRENDDLACKEELYKDDVISDCSSCQETAFSELQPEVFPKSRTTSISLIIIHCRFSSNLEVIFLRSPLAIRFLRRFPLCCSSLGSNSRGRVYL